MLAAVGHDLRTPLAAAKAAVSSLRQTNVTWTPEKNAEPRTRAAGQPNEQLLQEALCREGSNTASITRE